jgi:tRNA (cmo5U34)-methyltransferase
MNKQDDLYSIPITTPQDFRFDERVVSVFPDMINRSVPGYALIVPMIGLLARRFVTPGSKVYDLGCSLGACSLAIRQALSMQETEIIAVDNSAAMVSRCQELVAADTSGIPVQVKQADILDTPINNASLVVLNFTLQFLPPEARNELLETVFSGLLPGAALVLSEKVRFGDQDQQELFTDWHHDFKKTQGYSDLEIAQKRNALEKIMIPETSEVHFDRLSAIGFHKVYNWYQCFNFFSIIAIK